MKLAIDIDGCLADFNSAFHRLLVQAHGDRFPHGYAPHQPPVWEWPRYFGYTEEEEGIVWKAVHSSRTFWQELDEEPYGSEALHQLDRLSFDGHDIYFVTNRRGLKAKLQTERWLEARGMYNPTVLLASNKIPILKSLGVDAFVDDKPETLLQASVHCWPTRVYQKLTSYNVQTRIKTVQIIRHVQEMVDVECNIGRVFSGESVVEQSVRTGTGSERTDRSIDSSTCVLSEGTSQSGCVYRIGGPTGKR